jgi:hypothetical protein
MNSNGMNSSTLSISCHNNRQHCENDSVVQSLFDFHWDSLSQVIIAFDFDRQHVISTWNKREYAITHTLRLWAFCHFDENQIWNFLVLDTTILLPTSSSALLNELVCCIGILDDKWKTIALLSSFPSRINPWVFVRIGWDLSCGLCHYHHLWLTPKPHTSCYHASYYNSWHCMKSERKGSH